VVKTELSDKINAVKKMQQFIVTNLDETITLSDLSRAAGYSKYYCVRIFKELVGKTPFDFFRALRLTKAAQALQNSDSTVLDCALDNGFESHDGFTRAFVRQFGITPQRYSRELPAVNWFIFHPIQDYYALKEGVEIMSNEKVSRTVTVSVVERPARKVIYLRYNANDYLSACEEVGCEWEGFFNSIPEAFDNAAMGRLPESLFAVGTSRNAFFVEVPLEYNKPIPHEYEIAEVPPCTYLCFNGMPYDNSSDFGIAIGIVNEAVKTYPFERFGWRISKDSPYLSVISSDSVIGARAAVPVEKI